MEGHQHGRRWIFCMVLAACATSSACTGAAPQVWASTFLERVLASLTHPTAVESAPPARCLQAHCPCTRYKVDRQATYVRTASDPCIAQRAIPLSCGECFVSHTNNVKLSLFSIVFLLLSMAVTGSAGQGYAVVIRGMGQELFGWRRRRMVDSGAKRGFL